MRKIEDIMVWHKARVLIKEVYMVTRDFPKEEQYGLVSQLRRAVVSIAANIAEGAGRNTNEEFKQFLGIASGSAYEVQTLLQISNDLQMVTSTLFENLNKQTVEIQKMIFGFQQTLNK